MRLLLISRCPPYPLHFGDRLIPNHLAQQLAARGYDIDLIAFYNRPDDPQQIEQYRDFFHSVRLIPESPRRVVSYVFRLLDRRRFFPQNERASWSPEMYRAIREALAAQSYDLVQLFGGVQVYEYRDLVRSLPNLIVPYESYSLFLERLLAQQNSAQQRLIVRAQLEAARRYERAMFDGYQGVVVLAEPDRRALFALNPSLPVQVIPNGVDTDYFRPAAVPPSDPVLLFVGNFEYGPNVDAALWLAQDIFPRVARAIPQARLLLVGNNPPEALRGLATPNIEVTGRVPDVRVYQDRAMIFVCPLRFGAGIKNKVLEALAMGKPLVGTRLSCDGIDVQENTHALYGESADQLAAAILHLIGDEALRKSMSAANRQFVEAHFTWKYVADQYETLYRKIIAERSQS